MSRIPSHMKFAFSRYMVTVQVILAIAIFNASVTNVTGNAVTPEIPTVSDNESEFSDMMGNEAGFEQKRNWQSLQGSWGKRSSQDFDDSEDDIDHILPVLVVNMDPKSRVQTAFLINGATLERLTNPQRFAATSMENIGDVDDNILNEKRAWKSLNVAWGKRLNGPTWNKFRGAWGKREPNWNNLKGIWGKRSKRSTDWRSLGGAWGKRSLPDVN